MKFAIASLVFILALALTPKTLAAEEVCTADKKEHCIQPKSAKTEHGKAGEDHEEKLGEKMNSLFPEKQKNPVAQTTRPEVVKLTFPKFLAKITGDSAKLEWSTAEGASNYHVQIATDPNFKWLVANDPWVKGTSFEVKQLEGGKKYFWRVAAVKSQNDSMSTKSLFVSSVFSTQ